MEADFSFSKHDATKTDLCNLQKANFQGAEFDRCQFKDTYLAQANFENAKLIDCVMTTLNLQGTNMRGITISGGGTIVDNVDFTNSDFEGAKIIVSLDYYISFDRCNFTNVNFKNLKVKGIGFIDLTTCDMSGANFEGVSLVSIHLTPSQLRQIKAEKEMAALAKALGVPYR